MSWWQWVLIVVAVWVFWGGALAYLWFVHRMRVEDEREKKSGAGGL